MSNRIAVHDWSLDRSLGRPRDGDGTFGIRLLDLPRALREHGYDAIQICHFHLPTRDAGYLRDLRAALDDNGVRLDALLIDDGDLTHPQTRGASEDWISGWLESAAVLSPDHVRVIAGQTRADDALQASSAALGRLAARFPDQSILTENWFDVTASPSDVHAILEPLEGRVRLLIDLANWGGESKYRDLADIARYGVTCHAKAHWGAEGVDETDFRCSLAAIVTAGYTGPLALVFDADEPGEWEGLARLREIAVDQVAPAS